MASPCSRRIEGSQPNTLRSRVLSLLRPRTPCGPVKLCRLTSFLPAMPDTMSTNPLMVTSSSVPRFRASRQSDAMIRVSPSTQSSTYMNERVCSPSPQISISLPFDAMATFREIAAGAFSLPPSYVPRGP